MALRRPPVSAFALLAAVSLAAAAGRAIVVSPVGVLLATVVVGLALRCRRADWAAPALVAVALVLTVVAGAEVVRAPILAPGAIVLMGLFPAARYVVRRTGLGAPVAVGLALAAAAAGGVAATRVPAVALGFAGVVGGGVALARWGVAGRLRAAAAGATAGIVVCAGGVAVAAGWAIANGGQEAIGVAGGCAGLVCVYAGAAGWRRLRGLDLPLHETRLAGLGLVAAAAGSAGVAGVTLGRGQWAFAVVFVAFCGWLSAASRWGAALAGFAVITVALPLYGVPWLASFTSGLGLFTVLILGLFLPSVAIGHRRALWDSVGDRHVQLVLAFGAVVVASLLTAPRTDLSVELAKTYAGRAVVLPLLICAVFVGLGRERAFAAIRAVAETLIVIALLGAGLSVLQVGFKIGYPATGGVERQSVLQFVGSRAIGFSESPGTWAAFLLLPFGFAAAFAVQGLRPRPIVSLLGVSGAVMLSGLRSAWVGMAAGTMVVAGLGRRTRYGVAVVLVMLATVALTLQVGNFRAFVSGGSADGSSPDRSIRIGGGRLASDESARSRLLLLRAELELGASRPLTGVGLGNIGGALVEDRPSFIDREAVRLGIVPGVPIEKHNVFTGLFAELGLPGVLAFVLALAAGISALLQCRRLASPDERMLVNGLLTALIATMVVANATEVDRQVFIWWILGVSLGLRAAMASSPEDRRRTGMTGKWSLRPTGLTRLRRSWVG